MTFEPFLLGWIVLLPLIGFVVNGALALVAGRRAATALRTGARRPDGRAGDAGGGDAAAPSGPEKAPASEHDPTPATDREAGHAESGRPWTHTWPTWIAPGVLLAAFVLALVNFVRMFGAELHEPVVRSYWTWMDTGAFRVEAALLLDQLSMVMTLVVTGVGFLIHVFSVGYMRDDPGYPRYFAYLNLFVFFMLVLVLGASYPVMFVGWEGVGLCSYLLIGFWFTGRENADAGKKAFIVNRIGDVGFLLAMFLLFGAVGSLEFTDVFGAAEGAFTYGGGLVTGIALLFLLGATGKSAQIPLYTWLPDAMAGPTPVSALIHAATMVTAGIYLVARSSVLFALAPAAQATVAGIGVLTALFAATIALAQNDIKKVLAYSTISQLGYMFLGVGVGAYTAGVFHLMTHAFFKALLFLGAGAVIHSMHHALHRTHKEWDAQDMRNMGGLRRHMPITWITMWIATLAIAGIWPFAGFFSKDEIIWSVGAWAGAGEAPYPFLYAVYWALALVAALLTAFYMTRLMVLTFHGPNRTGKEESRHFHEAPPVMTVPLMVLAALSIFGGWINVPHDVRDSFLGFFGALPMSEWLHHFLEPVVAPAKEIQLAHLGEAAHHAPLGGGEVLWATTATVLAAVVILAAVRIVGAWEYVPAGESPEPRRGLHRVLWRKYYVDELYDRLFVRPVLRGSDVLWRRVDVGVVDAVVNGAGHLSRGTGWVVSLLQTGRVNTYAFVFTVGVLVILVVVAL